MSPLKFFLANWKVLTVSKFVAHGSRLASKNVHLYGPVDIISNTVVLMLTPTSYDEDSFVCGEAVPNPLTRRVAEFLTRASDDRATRAETKALS